MHRLRPTSAPRRSAWSVPGVRAAAVGACSRCLCVTAFLWAPRMCLCWELLDAADADASPGSPPQGRGFYFIYRHGRIGSHAMFNLIGFSLGGVAARKTCSSFITRADPPHDLQKWARDGIFLISTIMAIQGCMSCSKSYRFPLQDLFVSSMSPVHRWTRKIQESIYLFLLILPSPCECGGRDCLGENMKERHSTIDL